MSKHQQLKKTLRQQETRIHVLLAALISSGLLCWDDFLIRPQGTRTRAYLKDVISSDYKKVHPSQKLEKILIDINQEGIFDMLPDGLFHQPTYSDAYDSINTYIEETKQQRKEKEDARRFFAPFEQETHQLRIKIAQQEQLNSVTISNPIVKTIFKDFWGDDTENELAATAINLIIYLLPLAYRASSDLSLLARCFSVALQEEVVITTKSAIPEDVLAEVIPALGQTQLGLNMVLGTTFNPLTKSIFATIGPISTPKLENYLPGRSKANLIAWLERFFIPFECKFDYQIITKRKEKNFILNQKSHLGYSTTLN